jgi:hypothetical protein
MSESDERPDYVWHFKLPGGATKDADVDALAEMVRQQVKAVLRCVTLTGHGVALRVTGFRFMDEPGREHALDSDLGTPRIDDAKPPVHGPGPGVPTVNESGVGASPGGGSSQNR